MKYEKGAFFGERALLTQMPRAASVKCKTACCMLRIDRTAFEGALARVEEEERMELEEANRQEQMKKGNVRKRRAEPVHISPELLAFVGDAQGHNCAACTTCLNLKSHFNANVPFCMLR